MGRGWLGGERGVLPRDQQANKSNECAQFIWSNVPAGVYSLFARATDNLGATNDSSLLIITNKQPGFVKLDSPQNTNGYFSLLIQGEAG